MSKRMKYVERGGSDSDSDSNPDASERFRIEDEHDPTPTQIHKKGSGTDNFTRLLRASEQNRTLLKAASTESSKAASKEANRGFKGSDRVTSSSSRRSTSGV